ncbi:MAG: sugar transferase [Planctomycetota bacterium]|nr:sugar transferase [Planctomycetota bacterium]
MQRPLQIPPAIRPRQVALAELMDPAAAPACSEPAPVLASERHLRASDAWDRLTPKSRWYRFGRPMLDIALLVATLPAALAISCVVAVGSAISFGSLRRVFFVQPRVGQRGRIFRLVKFRTMREPKGSVYDAWSGGDHARVTQWGKFLRSTHLDELPQLYNVLRGDMSFIGPRPEMAEVEAWANTEVPGFSDRLAIKPGITGLAQVTQGYTPRDADAYRRKLAINLEYLARVSLQSDLEILGRTLVWMALGRGWKWRGKRG